MANDSFQRTIEDLQITGDVGVVGRETATPSPGSELSSALFTAMAVLHAKNIHGRLEPRFEGPLICVVEAVEKPSDCTFFPRFIGPLRVKWLLVPLSLGRGHGALQALRLQAKEDARRRF
jgi:hypothetical protein